MDEHTATFFFVSRTPLYHAILSEPMNIPRPLKFLAVFLALFGFAFSLACSWKLSLLADSTREARESCLEAGSRAGCPVLFDQAILVQDIFSSALPDISLFLLASFLLAALTILSAKNARAKRAFSASLSIGIPDRHFQDPAIFLFNHLRLAFAQGILNPKIPSSFRR